MREQRRLGSEPALSIEKSFAASLTAMPSEPLTVAGAFYVPAYSSVLLSQGKLRVDFAVTLSIHSTSSTVCTLDPSGTSVSFISS